MYDNREPEDILTPLRKLKKHLEGNARKIEINPRDTTERDRIGFLEQFKVFRPRILVGYANSLYALALLAKSRSIELPPVKGIISGAEMLTPKMRNTLEDVFRGRAFNRYGSYEFDIIAGECPYGSMHANDDNLLTELVDSPQDLSARVVVTDLNNYAMPMLRYDLNDYAAWGGPACSCGRGLSVLSRLDGRVSDIFVSRDGRHVNGLSTGIYIEDISAIKRFQLIQKEYGLFHLYCVVDQPLKDEDFIHFRAKLKEFFGPETVLTWEVVKEIRRTEGGKYKFYISELS